MERGSFKGSSGAGIWYGRLVGALAEKLLVPCLHVVWDGDMIDNSVGAAHGATPQEATGAEIA
jgi:hypothetical protein